MRKPIVSIIMGSDSDLSVMKDAAAILDTFHVPYELTVLSAHRTPRQAVSYASTANKRGIKIIIAAAGGAAHLPGVIAAFTVLPVIGVPIKSMSLDGIDSLLSIVQMPAGVPVATVSINGSANAALLALEMLALGDTKIVAKLKEHRSQQAAKVKNKAQKIMKLGYKKYLESV